MQPFVEFTFGVVSDIGGGLFQAEALYGSNDVAASRWACDSTTAARWDGWDGTERWRYLTNNLPGTCMDTNTRRTP